MRKTKVFVICVLVVAIMVGVITKSKAMTITPSIPSSVSSGASFNLVFDFEKKVSAITGCISFNSNILELDSGNEEYVTGSSGTVTIADFAMQESQAKNKYTIKFKAKNVNEAQTAELNFIDFAVATVDNDTGTCTGTYTVTVTPGSSQEETQPITVDKEQVTIKVGENATVTAQGGNGNYSWSTANGSVATVSNGTITGVAVGSTTVSVTDGTNSKNIQVTVEAASSDGKDDDGGQSGGNTDTDHTGDGGSGGSQSGSGNNDGNKDSGSGSGSGSSTNSGNSSNSGSSSSSGSSSNSGNSSNSGSNDDDTRSQYYVSSGTNSTSPRKISQTGETGIIVGVIGTMMVIGFIFRKKCK